MTSSDWMTELPDDQPHVDLRTHLPHPARVYDYLLGGKTNFAPDRATAELTLADFPVALSGARGNRAFMHRVVRHLAAEAGVRQFLDIGTGIPTSPNVHEIAQGIAPATRVVYVDNDPIVLAHARALLTSTPEGSTEYLDADFFDPDTILARAAEVLDFSQPIGLLVIALTHFMPDERDPQGVIRRLLEPLPSGSYLALSNFTIEFVDQTAATEKLAQLAARGITYVPRTRDRVAPFFDGLELVEPGIDLVGRWRPDTDPAGDPYVDSPVYGGVARKP